MIQTPPRLKQETTVSQATRKNKKKAASSKLIAPALVELLASGASPAGGNSNGKSSFPKEDLFGDITANDVSNAESIKIGYENGYYPYKKKMERREYEKLKSQLQAELLKVQAWVKDTGQRIVVLFEGRDAAGKGGTIKRFMEHLNPRAAHVVALEKTHRPRTWSVVLSALH